MLSTQSFLCRLLFEVEHLPMLLRLECRDYPHSLASESNCDPQNSSPVGLPDVGPSIFAVNNLECDVEGRRPISPLQPLPKSHRALQYGQYSSHSKFSCSISLSYRQFLCRE